MLAPTHRRTAKVFASTWFIGLHLKNITAQLSGKYLLTSLKNLVMIDGLHTFSVGIASLVFVRLLASYLAVAPDYDIVDNVPNKNDFNAKVLQKICRLLRAKHRSRLTHSIDLTLLTCLLHWLVYFMVDKPYILMLYCIGISSALSSHLFADMLTPEGVYLSAFGRLHVRLVPNQKQALPITMIGGLLTLVLAVGGIYLKRQVMFWLIPIPATLCIVGILSMQKKLATSGVWEKLYFKIVTYADLGITTLALVACII